MKQIENLSSSILVVTLSIKNLSSSILVVTLSIRLYKMIHLVLVSSCLHTQDYRTVYSSDFLSRIISDDPLNLSFFIYALETTRLCTILFLLDLPAMVHCLGRMSNDQPKYDITIQVILDQVSKGDYTFTLECF